MFELWFVDYSFINKTGNWFCSFVRVGILVFQFLLRHDIHNYQGGRGALWQPHSLGSKYTVIFISEKKN